MNELAGRPCPLETGGAGKGLNPLRALGVAPSSTAIHEASHAVINRLFAIPIETATIVPNEHFGGVVRGPGADPDATPADLIATVGARCGQAGVLFAHGESRVPGEAWLANSQEALISYVAGIEGERIAWPDRIIKGEGSSDYDQATLYAKTFAVEDDPEVISAILTYARAEAYVLLKRYWHCVLAVAEELEAHKTLDGAGIDRIIAKADADFELDIERKRRQAAAIAFERAKSFSPVL